MKVFALAFLLILAACTGGPSEIVRACMTATSAVRAATVLKAQGALTVAQVVTIDRSIATIDPICGADAPPDTTSALALVNDAVFRLNTMGVRY